MSTENATVLAVDDEHALLEVYEMWFGDSYTVKTAGSASAALSAFDESVDIVLLDRRMPGTSGDEVLRQLREDGHDCPVVMVTAAEPDEDAIELSFDEYVVKPLDRTELLDVVEQTLLRADDETANDVLDALGDEKTRRCCRVLNEKPRSAREIAEITGYSLPTVYRRLNALRQAGIIDSRTTIDPDGDHYETFTTVTERVTIDLDGFTVQREQIEGQEA